MNMYPAPGGPTEQTAFTIELFNFLDEIVASTRAKNEVKQEQSQDPNARKR